MQLEVNDHGRSVGINPGRQEIRLEDPDGVLGLTGESISAGVAIRAVDLAVWQIQEALDKAFAAGIERGWQTKAQQR